MKPAKVSKSKSTFSKLLARPFEGKPDLLQGFGQRGVGGDGGVGGSGDGGVVAETTLHRRKPVVEAGPCEPPGSDLVKRRVANARYALLNCPRRSTRWSSSAGSQAVANTYTRAEPDPTYNARNALQNGDIYPSLTENDTSTTPHTKPIKWICYVPDKRLLAAAANGRTAVLVPEARNSADVAEPAYVIEDSKVIFGVQDHEGNMDSFDDYDYSTRTISRSLACKEHLVTEENERISVGMFRPAQGHVMLRPGYPIEVSHWSADTEDIVGKVEPEALTAHWMTPVTDRSIENVRTMRQEIRDTFFRTRDILIEMGITPPDFDSIDSTPFQLGEDYMRFMNSEQAGIQPHWQDDIFEDNFQSGISDSSPSMTEEMFVLSDSAPTTPMESSCSTTLSPWAENAECRAQLVHSTIAHPKVPVERASGLAPMGEKSDQSKTDIALKKARRLGFSNYGLGTSYPSSYNFKSDPMGISSSAVIGKLAPSPVLVERSKFNGSIASRTYTPVEDRRRTEARVKMPMSRPSIRPNIPPLRLMMLPTRTNVRNLATPPPKFASNSVPRSGSRRYARQYIDFQKL